MQVQGEYKHTELDRSGSLFQLLMNSILTTRALTITHWRHQRPSRGTWHSKVTFSAKWNQDWFTNKTMTYAACGPSACMGLRPWSSNRATSDRRASNEQATHGPRARYRTHRHVRGTHGYAGGSRRYLSGTDGHNTEGKWLHEPYVLNQTSSNHFGRRDRSMHQRCNLCDPPVVSLWFSIVRKNF